MLTDTYVLPIRLGSAKQHCLKDREKTVHTCAKSRNLEACYLPAADPEIRQHIDICCLGP